MKKNVYKLLYMLSGSLKIITLFLFLPAVTAICQYQDFRFNHITTDDGLSKSSVTCILQDKKGFMWFGTFNGLNRYDGYEFVIYQYDQNDSLSISHNYISSIIEDNEGQLWIGTSDGLNSYDRSSDSFKQFFHDKNNPTSISDNQIEVIFEDSKKRLWIGTRNGGLDLFDRLSGTFMHYVNEKGNEKSISSNFIREIFEDSAGNLWIGHWNGSIDIFNERRNTFDRVFVKGKKLTGSTISAIVQSDDESIWIGTQGDGLYRVKYENKEAEIIKKYSANSNVKDKLSGNIILSLMKDKNERLWIGTEDAGLNILNLKTGELNIYQVDPTDQTSLNNNSIYCIQEDVNGNVWVGTYAGGINLLAGGKTYFHYYKHLPGKSTSLSHDNINGFLENEDGNIWVGTGGRGLDLFDRKSNTFRNFNSKNSSMIAGVILSLYEDSDHNFWVGSWADGLFRYNKSTGQFSQFTQGKNGIGSNNIFQIVEGEKGKLWLCTFWGGLTSFDTRTNSVVVYNTENSDLSDNDLRAITKDHNGNLWIGTDVGMDFFNPRTKEFKSYQHSPKDRGSISKGFVSYIIESSDSTLWVGTVGGLNKYDATKGTFKHYNKKNGLPNDEISCIIEDDDGILWISTTKGISRFDPKTEIFKNYDVSDGLSGMEFNTRSGYKTRSGEIIFGCYDGFNIFQPENLKDNLYIPPVFVNDFKIFNKTVTIGEPDSPLKKNILETDELELSYKNSVFSFRFVALNYISPEKNQYAYMMEGFDKTWNYVGSSRTATYTNLDPGDYIFRVKASNNDGIWNEKGTSIKITIDPPFWKTWWAYLIEAILIILIAYSILNYYITRQKLRNALKIEHVELEKMYELDQMKTQFFSNISHEFQSPMTLILSPLEKLITSSKTDERTKNKLMLVHRNAKRLQRMTNQLKDLNKLETGDLLLFLSRGDIIQFTRETSQSFQDYAKDHKIEFKFDSANEQWITWFDPDKLDKIIYNLLSNAFKFTPDGGEVFVGVKIVENKSVKNSSGKNDEPSRYVEIKVQDNGIGIAKDKIDHIFKRYYHLEDYHGHHFEGSGVGLAFVIELINLYKGKIAVESEEEKGTTFTVEIPIDEHYLEENQLVGEFNVITLDHALTTKSSTNEINTLGTKRSRKKLHDLPVMLIVEDDVEIRKYIKESFETKYRVFEAENGKDGFKKVTKIIPDIVITDIKMREVDGIELCKKTKNDEKTSHIPIIMLTGCNSPEDRIQGITHGADVYLTKPFNIDVLEAHISSLLDSRKKLQEKFSREMTFGPSKIPLNDIDEKFLQRITETIENHISDSDFNADVLSEKIGMSRMQLYRKLRSLTDQTVHEFIRNIRLKRAVQLLEQKRMTITEVAYEVGFNDLTYFARCFRKQFDKSPSEYISNK